MPSLRDVGELEALRRLTAARTPEPGVVVGPGDDAAVLAIAPGCEIVATTDAMVEGRHFLPEWLDARGCGARLATMNLSDLAAMGAEPRWALLSLGLRGDHDLDALLELQLGASETLEPWGGVIVGGNLTAVDGAEWYDLALIGDVAAGAAWRRSGARPGDRIAVSGFPGRAGAGLRLTRRSPGEARSAGWRELVDAWRAPAARLELARALRATGRVRAAIDVSDGLAGDLEKLAAASRVAVEAEVASLPPDPLLERAAAALGVDVAALRLGPSDDYDLIVAVDPGGEQEVVRAARGAGTPLSFIGVARDGTGVMWRDAMAAAPRSFDHFS